MNNDTERNRKPRDLVHVNPYRGMIRDYPAVLITDPPEHWRGRLHDLFGNDRPIELEIGSGSGGFLRRRAARCPDVNFLGLELRYKRLVKSAQKMQRDDLPNVRFFQLPAQELPRLVGKNELDGVWIQFPEPWTKMRRRKHRLMNDELIAYLTRALRPDARLRFKTDHLEYALGSLERFIDAGLVLEDQTFDLHNDPRPRDLEPTEFELLFKSKNQPVAFFELRRPRGIVLDMVPDDSWKRFSENDECSP